MFLQWKALLGHRVVCCEPHGYFYVFCTGLTKLTQLELTPFCILIHYLCKCTVSINNMHSHCCRNFSATLPARTTTLLQTQNDSCLFNIYFQGRQWICFLRMHDVCLYEYQDMAGIFFLEVKTYRKTEIRFAFVDIGNGRGWGNSRHISL